MTQRILLLSAPFGSGHVQAARAIAEACLAEVPDCETELVNVYSPLLLPVAKGHLQVVSRAPGAYRRLYHTPVSGFIRYLVRSALSRSVWEAIQHFQPTAIIATHPFPGAVAAYLRRTGRLHAPVAMAMTDFHPHPFWAVCGIDRYFLPSHDAAKQLQTLGIDPAILSVTGIPIRADFGLAPIRSRSEVRRVLVMGGGLGLGPIVEAVRSLAVLPQRNLSVTVVCGTNASLAAELTDLFGADPRFVILGYTDRIPQLMAEADLLLTKPGGVTCSEAMACGVPMLLLQPLPGHEEENAAYLTGLGAAVSVDAEWAGFLAEELLYTLPESLAHMRACARLAGRPRAAHTIAQEILQAHDARVLSQEVNTRRSWHDPLQAAGPGY